LNKRAVELSINFLVVVIISIVVLGLGIRLLYTLYGGAVEIRDVSLEDIDKQIGALVCEGTESACIGKDTQTIKRGDLGIFGLKVLNLVGSNMDFEITATKGKFIEKDGTEGTFSSDIECLPTCGNSRTETIHNHEEKDIAIGIKPGKNADSGTYIFDVVVCYDDNNAGTSDATGKCTPNDLYYFSKIYAKVP